MTTQGIAKPTATGKYAHIVPLPDPPREPDMQQTIRTRSFDATLAYHFAHRDDVLIAGEGYLRFNGNNDAERFVPDCIVTFGVDPGAIVARNGYVISEVGKPPDFILEVASRSTGRRDYTVKREGYAAYGVREYWRFDHTGGEFHDTALAGDTLVGDRYEPLEVRHEPDGLIWGHSPVLGLDICWDNEQIRLRDPATGEYIPTPEEAAARAESDAARADAEAARADTAEAELAVLREQLRRLQQD